MTILLCLLFVVGGCTDSDILEEEDSREPAVAVGAEVPSNISTETEPPDNNGDSEPPYLPSDDSPELIRIAVDGHSVWDSLESVRSELASLGIQMEIMRVDTTDKVFDAFINGNANAVGSTVAMLADMDSVLANSGKMPSLICVIAKSQGADSILAIEGIYTIRDLIREEGRIAVYPGSNARELLLWRVSGDVGITQEQRNNMENLFVWYQNREEAINAFIAGDVEALCTSETIDGANILMSSNLYDTVIIYGIVFDEAFINTHSSIINQFLATMMRAIENGLEIEGIAPVNLIENYALFGLREENGNWIQRRSLLGDLFYDMGGSRMNIVNADFLLMRPLPPFVNTGNATSVTDAAATLNGNVTSDNGRTITERGFWYGTELGRLDNRLIISGTTGLMTASLLGLQPNTTHYFKAYAVNTAGTTFGSIISFKTGETPPPPPEIRILQPDDELITVLQPDDELRVFIPDRSYSFNFIGNSSEFIDDPTETLERMHNDLLARGGMNVIIFGHIADIGVGDTPGGRQLSLERAIAVADRLVEDFGVSPGRIMVVGMGIMMANPNLDPADRRVDVVFINP